MSTLLPIINLFMSFYSSQNRKMVAKLLPINQFSLWKWDVFFIEICLMGRDPREVITGLGTGLALDRREAII